MPSQPNPRQLAIEPRGDVTVAQAAQRAEGGGPGLSLIVAPVLEGHFSQRALSPRLIMVI